jgi:hypothetical protein
MNDVENQTPARSLNIMRLLPLLAIMMIGMGSTAFCAMSVIPQWQAHEDLVAEVALKEEELNARARQPEQDDIGILQVQLDDQQSKLNDAANGFLTAAQADDFLDTLYLHADESSVEITNLQSQQSAQMTTSGVYDIRVLRLTVDGHIPELMNFIARTHEASVPSIFIANLSISEGAEFDTLAMDISIYTSPYAGGEVFAAVVQTPAPTPIPPTSTPQPMPSTLAPTLTVVEAAPVATEEPIEVAEACEGAPPTLANVGDMVIVDLNAGGALNILTAARVSDGEIQVLAQAYDNWKFQVLDGPVCGEWHGWPVWYWLVEGASVQGWVGEGTSEERWLCPLSEPECA